MTKEKRKESKPESARRAACPRTYRYVGGGAGIPGLPHTVTEEEAAALGLQDLLQAAIANGSYTASPAPSAAPAAAAEEE